MIKCIYITSFFTFFAQALDLKVENLGAALGQREANIASLSKELEAKVGEVRYNKDTKIVWETEQSHLVFESHFFVN